MNPQCKQIQSLWQQGKKQEALELTRQIIKALDGELENERRKKDS